MCKKMIETGSKTDDAKVKVAYDDIQRCSQTGRRQPNASATSTDTPLATRTKRSV